MKNSNYYTNIISKRASSRTSLKTRRDKYETIYDMLKAVRDNRNINVVKLICKANLNADTLKSLMQIVTKSGLLTIKEFKFNRKTFTITNKGIMFLYDYEKVRSYFNDTN